MKLELLEKLQKVDAPPYLLTRIEQKIKNQQQNISTNWIWGIGLACCLVFILDFSLLIRTKTDSTQESNLNESFHINPQNQLYSR
jgi:hypothetical protein